LRSEWDLCSWTYTASNKLLQYWSMAFVSQRREGIVSSASMYRIEEKTAWFRAIRDLDMCRTLDVQNYDCIEDRDPPSTKERCPIRRSRSWIMSLGPIRFSFVIGVRTSSTTKIRTLSCRHKRCPLHCKLENLRAEHRKSGQMTPTVVSAIII